MFKAGAAESLGEASAAVGAGDAAAVEGTFYDRAHRGSGIEARILLDTG